MAKTVIRFVQRYFKTLRKIIHIDMDAFFASVEQLDNPDLRGKPVAVGGSGERSVVAAASYEARRFGVRSAMPSSIAKKMCPDLIFARPRFDRYSEVSANIFRIFSGYSSIIEPLSIDEAFLDVTDDLKKIGSATIVAKEIKKEITRETGLTASAGISVNKFLAKIASGINKPDGIFVICEDEAEKFIEELRIDRFYGIGSVTAEKMHRLGIHTGADLKEWDMTSLVRNFGKAGIFYYKIARGIDERPVETSNERKSIGAEITFDKDLSTRFEIIAELYKIEKDLMKRITDSDTYGRTVTLKIKFDDFRQITRSKTILKFIYDFNTLHDVVSDIRKSLNLEGKRIRLLGVSISNLESEKSQIMQLDLFPTHP